MVNTWPRRAGTLSELPNPIVNAWNALSISPLASKSWPVNRHFTFQDLVIWRHWTWINGKQELVQGLPCKECDSELVITFPNPSGRFMHIDPGRFVVVLCSHDKKIFFFFVFSLGFTKVAVIGTESVQDCYPLVLNISIVLVNILSRGKWVFSVKNHSLNNSEWLQLYVRTRAWPFLQYLTELINFSLLEVLSLRHTKVKPKSEEIKTS